MSGGTTTNGDRNIIRVLLSEQLRLGSVLVKAGTMTVADAASFFAFCIFSTNKRNAGLRHQSCLVFKALMRH